MSRRTFINILENIFDISVNQAMKLDLIGKSVKSMGSTLANATPNLNFSDSSSISIITGSVNITSLNAIVTGMEEGEEVLLVITQGATPRTIVWGTNFIFAGGSGPTVTASGTAVDVFKGVVVGGKVLLSIVAQNVS